LTNVSPGVTPDPTRDCPSLDPNQLPLTRVYL
jgi:hypothetical protein